MAETRMTTDIGTKVIIKNLEYKHCGILMIEKKKRILPGHTWVQKYFMITKGAKGCCWNLFCFTNQCATRAKWAYSMKEMESVREYEKSDEDIVGFRIVFEAAKMPEIILRCDTEENRVMWMSNMQEAISEAHSYSIDSGVGSGASVDSFQRHLGYDSIKVEHYEDISETGQTSIHKNKNNAEKRNVVQQADHRALKKQQWDTECYYINVVTDHEKYKNQGIRDLNGDVKKIGETMLKLPISVEEASDLQVILRDPSNKPQTQDMTDKRNAVVVSTDMLPVYRSSVNKPQYKVTEKIAVDTTVDGTPELTRIGETTPTMHGATGTMALSRSQSIARSESFVSVRAASDQWISLHAPCGTVDELVDTGDYQNFFSIQRRDSSSSSGSDTTTYENPTCFRQDVKPDEYFCEEGQNPLELLGDTPVGTFLIDRKKRGLALHVMTQAGVKCFKLFEQNGRVSLYNFSMSPDSVFSSLDNFLKHYNVHCIPKEEFSVRLIHGYKNVIVESVETDCN